VRNFFPNQFILALACLLIAAVGCHAGSRQLSAAEAEPVPSGAAGAPITYLSKPGKLLVEEPLNVLPVKGDWRFGPGTWEIVDGVLKGTERAADHHGAALRRLLKVHDAIVRYEFRIDGGKTTTLSVNDDHGHVCRASMTSTSFSIRKDDHDHDGPDKAEVFETQKVAISPGEWHTLVIELRGPEMVATLDGTHTAFGANALVDCEKGNFGFTVAGDGASFRNLQIWEALPNPGWTEKKAELEKARGEKRGQ
jgi:hypothetical protein